MIALLLACAAPPALPHGASAEDCAGCHTEHAAEWEASAHARSDASAAFLAMVPRVEAAWGEAAAAGCVSCHAPDHGGDRVVSCVSCHAAAGNSAPRDGRLVVNLAAPLSGPLGAQATPTSAHTSTPRGLLSDSELCITCHEVTGPGLLVEQTGTEYDASPAASDGQTCADCHAPPTEPRPLVAGGPVRASVSHRFEGRTNDLEGAIAIELSGAKLTIRSLVTGHSVPTGASWLRGVWVEAEVNGAWVPVYALHDQPLRNGEPVELITDADSVLERRLAPGASVEVELPAGATDVRVRSEAIRAGVAAELGLDP